MSLYDVLSAWEQYRNTNNSAIDWNIKLVLPIVLTIWTECCTNENKNKSFKTAVCLKCFFLKDFFAYGIICKLGDTPLHSFFKPSTSFFNSFFKNLRIRLLAGKILRTFALLHINLLPSNLMSKVGIFRIFSGPGKNSASNAPNLKFQ